MLLVALTSCEQKKRSILDSNNVKTTYLQSEELLLNEMPLLPKGCCLRDSFLIIFEPKLKDGFLSVYSLNNGNLLRRYGYKGEGPNEFQNPRFIFSEFLLNSSSDLLIGDIDALYLLNIDSIISDSTYVHSQYMKLPKELLSYNYLLNISDSTLVANVTNEGQFVDYNRFTKKRVVKNIYEKIEKFNNVDDFCYTTQIYDAYYTANKKNIIIAYKNWKQIDIVSMTGNLRKRIYFEDYQNNIDKIAASGNKNIRMNEDAILYFSYVFPTEEYFYALCWNSTKENIKKGLAVSEIYKFDWDGNLLNISKLDKAISYFCIDSKAGKMYAIGTDKDLELKIYQYTNSDFLN